MNTQQVAAINTAVGQAIWHGKTIRFTLANGGVATLTGNASGFLTLHHNGNVTPNLTFTSLTAWLYNNGYVNCAVEG